MNSEKTNEFKALIQAFIDANGEQTFGKRIYWNNFPEKITANAAKGLKLPENEPVIMIIDASIMGSGKEGMVLTDWGVRYNDGVKSWSVTWSDLSEKYRFEKSITDGALGTKTSVLLLQAKPGDDFTVTKEISMSMADIPYDLLARILSKTCQIFTGKSVDFEDAAIEKDQPDVVENRAPVAENTGTPVESEDALIEAFIGDKDTAVFYKKAFSKYSVNGIEKFGFCFSWGGFVFGAINLFHRKLYKEAVIWLIGSAVLSGISAGFLAIILFFAGAFVNPYLIYKRFKKILAQCDAQAMLFAQKIETLKAMGGTNPVTSVIAGIAALIAAIVFVVFVFRGIFG
jgi:hypothetical protein